MPNNKNKKIQETSKNSNIEEFKPHLGHFLPNGLKGKGKQAWDLMSHSQHKEANNICSLNTQYHKRVVGHLNHPKMDPNLIETGGYLKGLSPEGKKAWDIIPADLQFEVILAAVDGTTPNVVKFLNNCWTQYKQGTLDHGTLLHGVQTLSAEIEENRMVQ